MISRRLYSTAALNAVFQSRSRRSRSTPSWMSLATNDVQPWATASCSNVLPFDGSSFSRQIKRSAGLATVRWLASSSTTSICWQIVHGFYTFRQQVLGYFSARGLLQYDLDVAEVCASSSVSWPENDWPVQFQSQRYTQNAKWGP